MNKNNLLARLASHYQYREEPFRLSSGETSNHYLDCRAALSDPSTLHLAAEAVCDQVLPGIEAVGGLTMGADPLAIGASLKGGLRWFSVRKEPKQHGTTKLIEGFDQPGAKVAVLEDVSTTGSSAKQAVGACVLGGLNVAQIIMLVDRGGASELRRISSGATEINAIFPFDDVSMVGRARTIAILAHGDQRYGDPETGPLYTATHLPSVVNVLAEMLPAYRPDLLAAAWLHDTAEDTGTDIAALRAGGNVPEAVLVHVDACTDGPGQNRKERKQRSYQLISSTLDTVLLKLSDRISNAEAARQEGKEGLVNMYRKENREFFARLKDSPVSPGLSARPFWDRLERALAWA